MRLSDSYDNLHTALRYKNNYTVRTTQEQILSKEGTAADRNSITIFSDHFIQKFKLFFSFQKDLFMDFLKFPKIYSRKTA